MGRKAINGYPEKSYYDNTVFNGVVATHDPLNEGSFALLTNLDIADTGKSVVPRKGYTSTTFSIDGVSVMLSDKLFIFRDPNIQKDIIIDFNKLTEDATSKYAYCVNVSQYNLSDNMLQQAHNIQAYDYLDFLLYMERIIPGLDEVASNQLAFVFSHSTVVGESLLKPIRDRDGVIYYVGKMAYSFEGSTPLYYWIKFLYREKETTVGGVTYAADTLVINYIDTEKHPTTFPDRNIASSKSIIYISEDPVTKEGLIRSQEIVGEDPELTRPSEINRPLLLKVGNHYATTKIPETLRTSLDIRIEPSFHLQDPARILGTSGDDERWAYRFDFVRPDTSGSRVIYKTPWRHLTVYNTHNNGANETISQLRVEPENANDTTYTYYVISESTHSWLTVYNATSFLSSLTKAEETLYEKMRSNGVSGSSGSSLGNLAFAYLKQDTLGGTTKPSSIQLEDLDDTVYEQMNFKFISEDDLKTGVVATGNTLEDLDARTAAFTAADVTALTTIYPSATTEAVSAPIFPTSYAHYNAMKKMNVAEFVAHAKTKQETNKIRIVFVPFIYRHVGTDTGTSTAFDNIYICSLGGIYINGLKDNLGLTTGDIAPFNNVVSVKKNFTFTLATTEIFVDCFNNLSSLYLFDAVKFIPRNVFDRGVFITLYLKPYNNTMLDSYAGFTTNEILLTNKSWDESAYKQSSVGVWAPERDVVYIDEVDEENYIAISNTSNHIVFEDRLVLWSGNKVYISEEGDYYYFNNLMKKIFPEEVLKVISFKNILLVFTTQNLYAIYRAEIDTFTGNYSEQGLPEYIKSTVWLQQPVLYNINPERKYLDVIQVYNQMILFYSNEGQLYMIKPSTMIDSETQFGIQYFNKSVNNILANYEQYINERLKLYGKLNTEDETDYVKKEDVKVKALIDIDLIKIFYTVPPRDGIPGRMTFVLIYDVVNNRYTTYDTLSFTDINFVKHVEGGEMYLTKHNDMSYFTLPVINTNNVDQNVDMHYARMFKKEPIFTFIDTGNLNLNNHLRKRLRDLRIVLKNLDSTKILYNAELVLDDTIIRPFYGPDFKVKMMNGPDSSMVVNKVPVEDLNELFGMNETIGVEGTRTDLNSYYLKHDADFYMKNSLLRTETLNSSRLIEYNSSILGLGKVIRIRLQFISKGKYKLQSFGIVYKERRI